jgi:hypothetical protein
VTAQTLAPETGGSVTLVHPPPVRRHRAATEYLRWWPLAAVAAVNALVLVAALSPVRASLVLPLLILVPGHLTLRLTGTRRPSGPDRLLHTVAFGVLWLIGISFVLALLGALTPGWCLAGFDVVATGLAVAAVVRGGPQGDPRATSPVAGVGRSDDTLTIIDARGRALYVSGSRPGWRSVPLPAVVAVFLAGAAVALAAAGARRLNAGGSALWTELALAAGALALLLIATTARGNADSRSDRAVLPAAAAVVYLLGLAVLLATSLRGIGVTGHDIKPEFRVFQDTLATGAWRTGVTLADYNSCLSITTLPTLLHHLLGVAPLDVFRICFQVVFAAVPVGVLLVARTLVPTAAATLAAGLYIAFPTFVNDMPMLNRQELALLFFTVAVLTLLDRQGSRRQRTAIFVSMIAGLTVSHYSSTYVAGGVMLAAWLLLRTGHLLRRRTSGTVAPIDRNARTGRGARLLERVDAVLARVSMQRARWAAPHLLTFPAVAAVLLTSAVWSFASGSGGGLVTTIKSTAASVVSHNGTESDAVGYSFLRKAPAVSDREALREFITANGSRPSAAELATADIACPVVLKPEAVIPRTPLGTAMANAGAAPEAVNRWSRQLTVVLFQLGAIAGTVLLWVYSRRKVSPAHILAVLSTGTLAALGATVVLPQLSVDYGLLRLFQQSLVILAPAVMLAVTGAARVFGARAAAAAGALAVTGCLLSTSGLVPQVTGGFAPQLNLNNAGGYYRAYYTSRDDLLIARWVEHHLAPDTLLSADSADFRTLRSTTGLYPLEGVAPGMVPPRAYLQVDTDSPDRVEAVAIARDRVITYTFRRDCVTAGRPLLFSAGTHRVYGPAS